LWSRGVKLISVTAHIRNRWAGGAQVVNSFNIKGADRWDELSILTLVMIPGDFAPVPAALVMKEQLGAIEFANGQFKVTRRLPYRLPRATPSAIRDYLQSPANLHSPAPGETPSDEEIQPFREKLSREQIKIVLAEIEREKEESVLTLKTVGITGSDNGNAETDETLTPLERARRKRMEQVS